MKNTRGVFTLVFALFAVCVHGAEIRLIYPRVEYGKPIVYPATLDSTFVLGNITPTSGRLQINGTDIPVTSKGAFLAWLPLRKTDGQTSWDLHLLEGDKVLAEMSCPYQIGSASSTAAIADTALKIVFPNVVEVTAPNSHIRTAAQGTYYIFPETGCRILATGLSGGFYRLDLGGGFPAAIDTRFVDILPATIFPAIYLGDGHCRATVNESVSSFALPEPVAWHAELSPDGTTLNIELFRVTAAIQRIRYDVNDRMLREIVWDQRPYGVRLSLRCRQEINRGYEVEWRNDSLHIRIRTLYSHSARSLRGKTIVLDAGHGGISKGSIGPLGTEEKDITLKWARILQEELEKRGAIVRLTRQEDVDSDLYDRIDIARQEQADFLLSLHCNALPDHENPLLRHGTGTYYYQSHSQQAAEILHRELLKASGLRDDGLYDANLALVRPTSFPSVLIEGAYIIYPPEEELLQTEVFLGRLSKGVARGLAEYYKTAH